MKKTKRLTIRLTTYEQQLLAQRAKGLGITQTDIVRAALRMMLS